MLGPTLSVLLILATDGGVGATVLHPCGPRQKTDLQRARTTLEELGRFVEQGDTAHADQRWEALKLSPCFAEPLLETTRQPRFDDVEASRWWWQHGGGEWLHNAIEPRRSPAVIPPDWPPVLRRENERGRTHELRRLLCDDKDVQTQCGKMAAGWVLRAEEAFEAPNSMSLEHRWTSETAQASCTNELKAKTAPKDGVTRFMAWRECIESERELLPMLPLARFDVPHDGWLILRGRRGHYSFCDEVRAYDLESGAMYLVQSCSGLALKPTGQVDGEATDAARKVKVIAGRLPLDALREAAWMILFARDVEQHMQKEAWYVDVPKGLEPAWRPDGVLHGTGKGEFWTSSGQTQLAWSWQGSDGLRASGSITWPNSANAGENHAVGLLRVAEASLVEGCPPAPPPARLIVGGPPGFASSLDSAPQSLRSLDARLAAALTESCGH